MSGVPCLATITSCPRLLRSETGNHAQRPMSRSRARITRPGSRTSPRADPYLPPGHVRVGNISDGCSHVGASSENGQVVRDLAEQSPSGSRGIGAEASGVSFERQRRSAAAALGEAATSIRAQLGRRIESGPRNGKREEKRRKAAARSAMRECRVARARTVPWKRG